MADQPRSNSLDHPKFFVAVRLIQLFQNGKKPIDLQLNVGEADKVGMRAPLFEGVDVQAIMAKMSSQQQQGGQHPMQQQQQQQPPVPHMNGGRVGGEGGNAVVIPTPPLSQQQHPSLQQQPLLSNNIGVLAVQDPYTMSPQELSRYEALFPSYAKADEGGGGESYVGGAAAVELFGKSGMDRDSLKAIWSMVDVPVDNKLDSIEFSVAMHLIVCVTKKGLPTPPLLPESLKSMVKYYRAQRATTQHLQVVSGGGGSVMGGGGGVAVQSMQQPPPLVGGMVGGEQPHPIPSPLSSPRADGGMSTQQHQINGGGTGGMSFGGGYGGGMPSSPNLIPTPRMGNDFNGGPQMPQLGGMQQNQQQYKQVQTQGQQYMQPQMQGQQYMYQPQQMSSGTSQMGYQQGVPHHQQQGSLGGGSTIDEAFAGLSNDPVQRVDEDSAAESDASPASFTPIQQHSMMFAPPLPLSLKAQLPPKSPKIPNMPRMATSARSPRATSPANLAGSSLGEDLHLLQSAHQKLLAEVISLRAKAASVSDEEFEVQQQIKSTAMEIGKLSVELSALKENVMEAKVKLGESIGILKLQMGKKESLEAQVTEARATHDSLAEAAAAVEEANELAMNYAAKAVAAASVAPAPAPVALETADLFSWGDSFVPAMAPAPTEEVKISKGTLSREVSEVGSKGGDSWVAHPTSTQNSWEAPPTPDRASTHHRGDSLADTSVISYASYQKYGVLGGEIGGPVNEGEMNPAMYGGPISGGGMSGGYSMGIPEPTGYSPHSESMPIYPEIQSDMSMAPTPKAMPYNPTPKSPSKEELESVKSMALKADQSFQAKSELVHSISTEVGKLESAAQQAEAAIGGEGKKSKMFGKKKAKKEYEAAVQAAQNERLKVEEAKAKLALAKREEEVGRKEMLRLRQQYEEMEMEAVTAQSMMSAGGYSSQTQYNGGFGASVPAPASSDPYGMSTPMMSKSAGGDYDNPFAF